MIDGILLELAALLEARIGTTEDEEGVFLYPSDGKASQRSYMSGVAKKILAVDIAIKSKSNKNALVKSGYVSDVLESEDIFGVKDVEVSLPEFTGVTDGGYYCYNVLAELVMEKKFL